MRKDFETRKVVLDISVLCCVRLPAPMALKQPVGHPEFAAAEAPPALKLCRENLLTSVN